MRVPDEPRYSENDMIRMMSRAGQVARTHDMEFARQLGVDGEPNSHLFMTKDDCDAAIEIAINAKLASINLPAATSTEAGETNYKVRRLFALEEDSRKFMRRIIWGTVAGIGTLVLGALATALKITGLK